MDFEGVLSAGWRNHESDTAGVAASLEEGAKLVTDSMKAAQFAAIVNHTIGEHLGDWTRAAKLLESTLSVLPSESALAPALGNLAVARFFAGDAALATAAETRAAALAGKQAIAVLTRIRMLLASGLLSAKRDEECSEVYSAGLDLANTLPAGTPADRAVAITSNNLASSLLERENRTETDDVLMVRAAEAARKYWLRGGTWENDERADYLLALVMNSVGRHEEGLEFARRGIATIESNGEEKVDEAFLHLAAAGAHRGLDNEKGHAEEISKAEALAAEFTDQGIRDWFESEAAKMR